MRHSREIRSHSLVWVDVCLPRLIQGKVAASSGKRIHQENMSLHAFLPQLRESYSDKLYIQFYGIELGGLPFVYSAFLDSGSAAFSAFSGAASLSPSFFSSPSSSSPDSYRTEISKLTSQE